MPALRTVPLATCNQRSSSSLTTACVNIGGGRVFTLQQDSESFTHCYVYTVETSCDPISGSVGSADSSPAGKRLSRQEFFAPFLRQKGLQDMLVMRVGNQVLVHGGKTCAEYSSCIQNGAYLFDTERYTWQPLPASSTYALTGHTGVLVPPDVDGRRRVVIAGGRYDRTDEYQEVSDDGDGGYYVVGTSSETHSGSNVSLLVLSLPKGTGDFGGVREESEEKASWFEVEHDEEFEELRLPAAEPKVSANLIGIDYTATTTTESIDLLAWAGEGVCRYVTSRARRGGSMLPQASGRWSPWKRRESACEVCPEGGHHAIPMSPSSLLVLPQRGTVGHLLTKGKKQKVSSQEWSLVTPDGSIVPIRKASACLLSPCQLLVFQKSEAYLVDIPLKLEFLKPTSDRVVGAACCDCGVGLFAVIDAARERGGMEAVRMVQRSIKSKLDPDDSLSRTCLTLAVLRATREAASVSSGEANSHLWDTVSASLPALCASAARGHEVSLYVSLFARCEWDHWHRTAFGSSSYGYPDSLPSVKDLCSSDPSARVCHQLYRHVLESKILTPYNILSSPLQCVSSLLAGLLAPLPAMGDAFSRPQPVLLNAFMVSSILHASSAVLLRGMYMQRLPAGDMPTVFDLPSLCVLLESHGFGTSPETGVCVLNALHRLMPGVGRVIPITEGPWMTLVGIQRYLTAAATETHTATDTRASVTQRHQREVPRLHVALAYKSRCTVESGSDLSEVSQGALIPVAPGCILRVHSESCNSDRGTTVAALDMAESGADSAFPIHLMSTQHLLEGRAVGQDIICQVHPEGSTWKPKDMALCRVSVPALLCEGLDVLEEEGRTLLSRDCMLLAGQGGGLIVAGGSLDYPYKGRTLSHDVGVFMPDGRYWGQLPDSPVPLIGARGVLYGNILHVLVKKVHLSLSASGCWTLHPPLPFSPYHCGLVSIGPYVVAFVSDPYHHSGTFAYDTRLCGLVSEGWVPWNMHSNDKLSDESSDADDQCSWVKHGPFSAALWDVGTIYVESSNNNSFKALLSPSLLLEMLQYLPQTAQQLHVHPAVIAYRTCKLLVGHQYQEDALVIVQAMTGLERLGGMLGLGEPCNAADHSLCSSMGEDDAGVNEETVVAAFLLACMEGSHTTMTSHPSSPLAHGWLSEVVGLTAGLKMGPLCTVSAINVLSQVTSEVYPDQPEMCCGTASQVECLSVILTAATRAPIYLPLWKALCRRQLERETCYQTSVLDLSHVDLLDGRRNPGDKMDHLLRVVNSVPIGRAVGDSPIKHHATTPTVLREVLEAGIRCLFKPGISVDVHLKGTWKHMIHISHNESFCYDYKQDQTEEEKALKMQRIMSWLTSEESDSRTQYKKPDIRKSLACGVWRRVVNERTDEVEHQWESIALEIPDRVRESEHVFLAGCLHFLSIDGDPRCLSVLTLNLSTLQWEEHPVGDGGPTCWGQSAVHPFVMNGCICCVQRVPHANSLWMCDVEDSFKWHCASRTLPGVDMSSIRQGGFNQIGQGDVSLDLMTPEARVRIEPSLRCTHLAGPYMKKYVTVGQYGLGLKCDDTRRYNQDTLWLYDRLRDRWVQVMVEVTDMPTQGWVGIDSSMVLMHDDKATYIVDISEWAMNYEDEM
ncbi:hypothetical protein KIPB_002975 [Kipferlia bialata]|uniref:Uncharacterized protein n=1 Tax=Kipferlia bialata TaxID=797122 RepID=A0A9K3CRR3_9EUKA|nr:hypothetical protein KIPB_002975 [Kipferlia bialata]|eukprot:g2975.t1